MNNKPLAAFGFLVVACAIYWMGVAQTAQQQLSYVQQRDGIALSDDDAGGIDVGLSESNAEGGFLSFGANGVRLTAETCPEIFSNELPFGKGTDDGPEKKVTMVQKFLVAKGYLDPADINNQYGHFGIKTENALIKLQKEIGYTGNENTIGTYDAFTNGTINNICDSAISPKLRSITPQHAARGDLITLAGESFPRRTQVKVVWYKYDDTDMENSKNAQYITPENDRSIRVAVPFNSGAYRIRVETRIWGNTQRKSPMFVVSSDGSGIPTQTPPPSSCSDIGSQSSCQSHANPICEWYNNICQFPSCGALSVATGTNDLSKYKFACGTNPGAGWALLGATDDCGYSTGSTTRGCFYSSIDGSANPPRENPPRIR